MKIVLLGYGRMGKAIEAIALQRGHQVVAIVDNAADWDQKIQDIKTADAAIDFSVPAVIMENIEKCFSIDLPIVVGTTGWYDNMEQIKQQCKEQKKKFLFASNFSIGVNLFFNLNQHLARLMNPYSEYEVSMDEIHHTQKLDAPSGTAISLANGTIEELDRINNWKEEEKQNDQEMPIRSHRIENVVGTHWLTYESDIDKIEIKHEAKNRNGFATGAVIAAELILKHDGFNEFKDLLF